MGIGSSLKKALGGGVPGAILGSLIGGPVGAGIGGLAGGSLGLSGILDPEERTQAQSPLETPEQAAARRALLRLFETGQFGGDGAEIGLGEDIGIQFGQFDLSPQERLALEGITSRFGQELTALTRAIESTLGFLDTTDIDPAGQFEPFKTRIEREIEESNDALKRSAAFFGNLFSTNTIERLGDVRARGNESLTGALADLTNQALNRRLTAAGQAGSLGGLLEDIQRGRLSDLLGVGGLERELGARTRSEANTETLRRRGEDLSRLNALSSILGSPVQFGVPSITISTPNQEVLNTLLGVGGNLVGQQFAFNRAQQLLQPTVTGGGNASGRLSLLPSGGF